MKKKRFLFQVFSIVSTLLLTLSVFISSISAVSVSNISHNSRSAYKNTSSQITSISKRITAERSSSVEVSHIKSSMAKPVTNTYAATPNADENSNTAGYAPILNIGSKKVRPFCVQY